ncbi:hypothetical protein ACFCT7_08185 [Fulvivirgaceae bacterium LMO-SS25]
MALYFVDMVLCGVVYLILVYFMFLLMRKRGSNGNGRSDDGDGGIKLPNRPKIDLPPGVVWPGSPVTKLEEPEEILF